MRNLQKTVVTVAGLIIVVPIVVRGLVLVGAVGYAAVEGVINQVKFNKKIKKRFKKMEALLNMRAITTKQKILKTDCCM